MINLNEEMEIENPIVLKHIDFINTDGGRSKYFTGEKAGDCVIRAIAIATKQDYKEVYDQMFNLNREFSKGRSKKARKLKEKGSSPRNGNFKEVYEPYILGLGFSWVSCMGIGTGMQTHLNKAELPKGILILRLSKHLACVINHTLYDSFDCSRNGKRGVYGYWIKNN